MHAVVREHTAAFHINKDTDSRKALDHAIDRDEAALLKRLIHHLLDGEFEGQDFLTSRSPRGVGWNHDRATPLSNKRRTMPQLSRTTLELRLKAPC
jgi:hypothetical protein